MKKILLLVLISVLCIFSVEAQQLKTNYLQGRLNVGNQEVGITLEFKNIAEKDETYLYIPEQMLYALKSSETTIIGDSMNVKFKTIGLEVGGKIKSDIVDAIFTQAKYKMPTTLKFVNKSDVSFLDRPQTPQAPYPYTEKEYFVENKKANATLCGTLTLPDTINKHKLIVLITGSGAQNRDEELAGHKPFLVIADYLTRNGFAVFRYDDRGYAKSTGNVITATTEDFSEDAYSIVKFFKNHPNIDSKQIGVLGHSEGGIIAMMLAAKYPKDIAFIISMAGPGVEIKELMKKQAHDVYLSQGIPADTVQILDEMYAEMIIVPEKSKTTAELRKNLKEIFDKYGAKLSEEQQKTYSINNTGLNMAVSQFSSPWLKYFFTIDPQKYLQKIKCPVLALNGNKDIQVAGEININAIDESLKNSKKIKYYESHILDGLNHLFQSAETGAVDEYFMIPQTIDEKVLKIIVDFLNKF